MVPAGRLHGTAITESDFARWFAPLLGDIDRFTQDRNSGRRRLINLHNALLELINFLLRSP
ncbi:MAG: hypothetical protein M3308_07830 [Actinomycetota bacterium]|nr:hypothetical protein [Actinomycetota bacterium]